MFQIRDFISTDIADVADLMSDLGYPVSKEVMERRMNLIIANPDYFTFIATFSEQVIGMIGIRISRNYETDDAVTYISTLVVKK